MDEDSLIFAARSKRNKEKYVTTLLQFLQIPSKLQCGLVTNQGLDSLKGYECLKSLVQLSSVVNVMGGILDSSKVHVKL